MKMTGTYDLELVALSVIIAIFASFAALDLAGRVTAARGRARLIWLFGGASAMGLGIWSMHYIGMLAFDMPMRMLYDVPTVVVSLLAAVAASTVALFTVSRKQMGLWQTIVGGTVMGIGIAAMHYIGMAAMRMAATITYNWLLVSLSILLAVVISIVALVLSFRVRDENRVSARKISSAVVMGSAIPVMHYTGMWAATFTASSSPVEVSHAISISSLGVAVISIATILILCFVSISAFVDRFLESQKALTAEAVKAEEYFRTLAEAVPMMLWTARPDGFVDFYNKGWLDYAGKTLEQALGSGWRDVIHPDDAAESIRHWQEALQTGESFKGQCRLRRGSDGTFRWHIVSATPARNANGEIVTWFGACMDIEDQRVREQTLEEEVRKRTEELVQANSSLTREMTERERTQLELNRQTEKLVKELTERSQTSALLTKMGELLHSCNTEQEAFSIVLGFAPKLFPLLGGAVILLKASKNLLEVVGSWDPCHLAMSVFEPNSCWALRTGHRYLVDAGDRTAPCAHAKGVDSAYLCIPIQAHGEALGVIYFQAQDPAAKFAEQQLTLANAFAEQIGLSIANIRLREALRNQSIRDTVTGLFNRRYLEETLEREIHRAVRNGQPLGVIMFDLDHFKRFNDTFGHDAGDAVLQLVGSFLVKHSRADDIACRYGGEEFVLILPNANLKDTAARAESLREALKEVTITHLGKPLGIVTVSAGVAALPQHGSMPAQIMLQADGALYRAKKAGRDRVVVAETASEPVPELHPRVV
jgi:diguanylate cyclase (GGDEF)-like protein/PAS domain S-box-containing protein